MEPLPATQDALRLELRSARSLEVRHLLLPSFVPSYHAARGTTIDSRVPPRHRHRRHRSHRRLYLRFQPSHRLTQRGEAISHHRQISRP